MALLINIPSRPTEKIVAKLAEQIPEQELCLWPDVSKAEQIELALVWQHQHGSLSQLPNLKAIASFGAGVDAILADPQLPDVPVTRIIDPHLADDMANYVLTMIQHHKLRLDQFERQQSQANWRPKRARTGNKVGILGFGQLGQRVGQLLLQLGFDVAAWARTAKQVDGICCTAGQQTFEQLVANSDYLVCLLPLTAATESILDKKVFALMPQDAALINVARGAHLVEADLLQALDQGQLGYAYLDVFKQEPLPPSHEFWHHDNIKVTPHISAVTSLDTAISQIVMNYQRIKQGLPLRNCIDKKQGY